MVENSLIFSIKEQVENPQLLKNSQLDIVPERIYNPITAMGFLAMFTFQLDNTKR